MNSADQRTVDYIRQLRSADSEVFDNAFDELCKNIDTIKRTIYRAAVNEQNPHAKGALIELLGESEDTKYVRYIAKQLRAKHPEVVFWSYVALQRIGTDEAIAFSRQRDIRAVLAGFRKAESGLATGNRNSSS